MYNKIASPFISSLLIVFGVFSAPTLGLAAALIFLISIAIIYFSLEGQSRFYSALLMILLSLIMFAGFWFMSNDSIQIANNQQTIDYIKNSSGEKIAQEFRLRTLNDAKYFEILSNASFFSAIFFGILSICIPTKSNSSEPQ